MAKLSANGNKLIDMVCTKEESTYDNNKRRVTVTYRLMTKGYLLVKSDSLIMDTTGKKLKYYPGNWRRHSENKYKPEIINDKNARLITFTEYAELIRRKGYDVKLIEY